MHLPLVQPEVLPRVVGHEVAAPRVRDLVRDHVGQRAVASQERGRDEGQAGAGGKHGQGKEDDVSGHDDFQHQQAGPTSGSEADKAKRECVVAEGRRDAGLTSPCRRRGRRAAGRAGHSCSTTTRHDTKKIKSGRPMPTTFSNMHDSMLNLYGSSLPACSPLPLVGEGEGLGVLQELLGLRELEVRLLHHRRLRPHPHPTPSRPTQPVKAESQCRDPAWTGLTLSFLPLRQFLDA